MPTLVLLSTRKQTKKKGALRTTVNVHVSQALVLKMKSCNYRSKSLNLYDARHISDYSGPGMSPRT